MKKSIILLALPFFLVSSKCNKGAVAPADNPYGLPNATQTGANIFACRINDSNWIRSPFEDIVGTSFHKSNGRDTFGIGAEGQSGLLTSMGITIFERIKEGASYRLNDTTKAIVNMLRLFADCGPTVGYGGVQWNRAYDGNLTITHFSGTYTVPSCCSFGSYDPNSIVSGTFNFIIAIPNCDTLKVTDGRFDINYSQF